MSVLKIFAVVTAFLGCTTLSAKDIKVMVVKSCCATTDSVTNNITKTLHNIKGVKSVGVNEETDKVIYFVSYDADKTNQNEIINCIGDKKCESQMSDSKQPRCLLKMSRLKANSNSAKTADTPAN